MSQNVLVLLLVSFIAAVILVLMNGCSAPTATTHHNYKNLRGDPCTMDCTVKCQPTPQP